MAESEEALEGGRKETAYDYQPLESKTPKAFMILLKNNLNFLPQLSYKDLALPVTPASSCATLTTLKQYRLSFLSTNIPSLLYLKALAYLQDGHHQSFPFLNVSVILL